MCNSTLLKIKVQYFTKKLVIKKEFRRQLCMVVSPYIYGTTKNKQTNKKGLKLEEWIIHH